MSTQNGTIPTDNIQELNGIERILADQPQDEGFARVLIVYAIIDAINAAKSFDQAKDFILRSYPRMVEFMDGVHIKWRDGKTTVSYRGSKDFIMSQNNGLGRC